MANFLQGFTVYGLVSVVITSIERRFDLSSSQSGLIASCFDIASCICLPFVSYFGGNGHKPRWLGWGIGIMGLGSVVFALPHFTTPSYQVTVPERSDLCSSNSTNFSVNKASDGLSNYVYVFVLAQLLHGIGATPLFTLGFTFLDENTKSNNSPIYVGIFFTATIIGPLVGMQLGGFFLRIYSETTMETELTPASPLWVGAWWIGFILFGTLSLPVAFFILGYPRKLPSSQDPSHQSDGSCSTESNQQFGKTLKDMPKSLLLLLKNPIFMSVSLATAAMVALQSVLTTFTPKYLESQFGFSSSEAPMILGAIVIPATGAGTFLGSFFVKRFQLQCRGMTRFCTACAFAGLLLNFMFLIECPTIRMAGVTAPHPSGQQDHHLFEEARVLSVNHRTVQGLNRFLNDELAAQCNANCSCDRQLFSPVCGTDSITYYSPCYAGCSSSNLTGTGQVYTDCGCVDGNASWGSASAGKCASSCPYTAVFITMFTLGAISVLLYSMPAITTTLRCVPENQKSFALGIQWIIVRTLGTIPSPIVFGSLIDQACLLKQNKDQGSCFLYENSQMSRFTFITCAIYEVIGTTFFFIALVLCRAPPSPPSINSESKLHCKTPPQDDSKVNHQTRL